MGSQRKLQQVRGHELGRVSNNSPSMPLPHKHEQLS